MKLYLVRHGETDWNKACRMQGRKGVGLNEIGVEQVRTLADEIQKRAINFDICFASPLKRAVESAEILVGGKCEILYDDRLAERCFGEFEGRSRDEYWKSLGKNDVFDRKLNYSGFGIEPIKDVLDRAKSFIKDITERYKGDTKVLVVAHGSLLRAMHFEIVGYDDATDFLSFGLKNAELREYDIDSIESLKGER